MSKAIRESDYFIVEVDEPSSDKPYDFMPGKITVSFRCPRIHFAFSIHDRYLSSMGDKEIAREYAINHAIQSFIGMIHDEIRKAFKDAEAEE